MQEAALRYANLVDTHNTSVGAVWSEVCAGGDRLLAAAGQIALARRTLANGLAAERWPASLQPLVLQVIQNLVEDAITMEGATTELQAKLAINGRNNGPTLSQTIRTLLGLPTPQPFPVC